MILNLNSCTGVDPGFFKRGSAQIKDWQNFGTSGDRSRLRGMWEMEKKRIFHSQFARFSALFLPRAPTQSQASSLCKKVEGAWACSAL